eukprot:jgi/Mesen1/9123/ME000058S08614
MTGEGGNTKDYGRQYSNISADWGRSNSMDSRASSRSGVFRRFGTLSRKKRFEFETDEELEEAAAALEDARRRRLESGVGGLEKLSQSVSRRAEALGARVGMTVSRNFRAMQAGTLGAYQSMRQALQSETVKRRVAALKHTALTMSTGRPSWDPQPAKVVPLPTVCNACTLFIIILTLLPFGAFYWSTTRDKAMSFIVPQFVGREAGPLPPNTTLPNLGQVCSSGDFGQQKVLPGTAVMNSSWWSSALGDGAQISRRSTVAPSVQRSAYSEAYAPPQVTGAEDYYTAPLAGQQPPNPSPLPLPPPGAAPSLCHLASPEGWHIQLQGVQSGWWWGADPSAASKAQSDNSTPPANSNTGGGASPPPATVGGVQAPTAPGMENGTQGMAADLNGVCWNGTDVSGFNFHGTFFAGNFFLSTNFNVTRANSTWYEGYLLDGSRQPVDASTLNANSPGANAYASNTLHCVCWSGSTFGGRPFQGTVWQGFFYPNAFFNSSALEAGQPSVYDADGHTSSSGARRRMLRGLSDPSGAEAAAEGGEVAAGRARAAGWATYAGAASYNATNATGAGAAAGGGRFAAWGKSPVGLYVGGAPSAQEFLTVLRINSTSFFLKAPNGKLLSVDAATGQLAASSSNKTQQAMFSVVKKGNRTVQIRAYNGEAVFGANGGDILGLAPPDQAGDAALWNVREVMQVAKIRGVNLGSWLVIEAWMVPDTYEHVPDLIDGWQVQLQSVATKAWLTVWQNNYQVHCNSGNPGSWETFNVRRPDGPKQGAIQLRSNPTGYYMTAAGGGGGDVYANVQTPGSAGQETFFLEVSPFDDTQVMIKTQNGAYLKANADGSISANGATPANGLSDRSSWSGNAVFSIKRVQKYNIRVVLSMHGAPGGQNYGHECASRDGIIDWAKPGTNNVQKTLDAVGWLVGRYAKSKAFYGIGVLNEPNSGGVPLDVLQKYYADAYAIVRQYSPCAFVGLHIRLGQDGHEFDGFMTDALQYNNVFMDTHLYHVFDPAIFSGKDFAFHIKYLTTQRAAHIASLSQGDRTVTVGEWSLGLPKGTKGANYHTFGRTQMEVYNNATAGWFMWSYKVGPDSTGYPNWSLLTTYSRGWMKYG